MSSAAVALFDMWFPILRDISWWLGCHWAKSQLLSGQQAELSLPCLLSVMASGMQTTSWTVAQKKWTWATSSPLAMAGGPPPTCSSPSTWPCPWMWCTWPSLSTRPPSGGSAPAAAPKHHRVAFPQIVLREVLPHGVTARIPEQSHPLVPEGQGQGSWVLLRQQIL